MCVRVPNTPKEVPESLPVFSTDTVEEADALRTLFCAKVHAGPLAGRHVVRSISTATDDDAIEAIHELSRKMIAAYARMKQQPETSPATKPED